MQIIIPSFSSALGFTRGDVLDFGVFFCFPDEQLDEKGDAGTDRVG